MALILPPPPLFLIFVVNIVLDKYTQYRQCLILVRYAEDISCMLVSYFEIPHVATVTIMIYLGIH